MKHIKTFLLLTLLSFVGASCGDGERRNMERIITEADSMNRNYVPMTSDSLLLAACRYYDSHGTPNERMKAHYLLGCVYRDVGEAPMALKCFQDATDCADTLSLDCNFAQLSRVYGQMAYLFYKQGLYRQQLICEKESGKYAWISKDTLAALISYEQESHIYKGLGNEDSAIYIIEDVYEKFNKYGLHTDAAISLGSIIRTLVEKEKYQKALKYMKIYEANSGFFDSCGNIETGREIYYKAKGLYYLRTNVYDSAEYYFRKELRDGKDFNNQNAASKGLLELYQIRHLPESVAKYSLYAYAMSDSLYAQRTALEIGRVQCMYDYTRNQNKAYQESEKANTANKRFLLCFIALLLVFLVASWLYIARNKLIESLNNTVLELDEIRTENVSLKQDASSNRYQIAENEKRIKQLEKKLTRYGKLVYFGVEKIENDMKNSDSYKRIKSHRNQKLLEDDWDTINIIICEYQPAFYDFIISHLNTDSVEYKICLLLRLHFTVGEVANMLGVSSPYISRISAEILANLYGEKGSSKVLYQYLCKSS